MSKGIDTTTHRRLRLLLAGALLAALALPGAAHAGPPASSGSVVRFVDNGNGFYMNAEATRSAITGAPAELACLGIRPTPVDHQFVVTASGAVVVRISGDERPIWVYDGSLDQVCGAVLSGGAPALVAEGSVRETYTDNDFFVSGTRVNSFGTNATGFVVDVDGRTWGLTASGRLQWTLDGDLRIITEDIRMTPRGN
ncbi:MAG TPA: hypothetical protein VFR14_02240 [Candidatus Limnocylindrales bacterium]|nr:hypothetical protein [Candidatus Limnocylindrales bacterium]